MEKNKLKIIAFIFARGGSKGLPNKNIKLLNGKPLIQYSIEIAKKIPQISDIFVSTDCELIASEASKNNIKVISRPHSLATDESPEWMAWHHAIDHVRDNFGTFDTFLSLPVTSPLRSVSDVELAINTLQNSDADICISVTPASRNPYFNMIKLDKNNIAELVINPDDEVSRRQEAPKVYDITTVAYVAKPSFIKKHTSIFNGKVVATVVPKNRAIDIDDIYDFKFAETVLNSELMDA